MINLGKTILGRTSLALAGASLLLAPMAALAKAGDLRDLVGARAGQAEGDLESRGWASMSVHKSSTGSYSYWWNARGKDCVRVATRDGRYEAITDTSAADCGQKGGSDGAAAAAVGVAALLGVLALSHKSHHRGDKDYQDQNDYADFERGHRDGLYNHPWSNGSRSQAYNDGYQSGVDERGHQSSYRPEYRNYQGNGWNDNAGDRGRSGGGWGGGGSDQSGFSDLVGARAAGVQTDLGNRGFRQVDSFQSGSNGVGSVWWNGRSRQCVQMITADGRADSIIDIGQHPRCR